MVEGERAGRERRQGRAHVGGARLQAAGEEALDRAVLLQHLPHEEEQAGDVAAVVEAVAEPAQAPRGRAGIETAHRAGRPLAERPQHGRDAALDLDHVAVGEGGRDQAGRLAVLVRVLRAHELERIGVDEPVIVMAVQVLEAAAQLVESHERS